MIENIGKISVFCRWPKGIKYPYKDYGKPMKRLLSLAVLGTAALLVPSSVAHAQRGMSGHGGGSSGFHSSGGGFHSSGGFQSSGGFHSSGMNSGFRSAPVGRSFGSTGFRSGAVGFRSGTGVRSTGFRSSGFRSTGFRSTGFRSSGVAVRSTSFRSFGGVHTAGVHVAGFRGAAFTHTFVAFHPFPFGFHNHFFFFNNCFGCFSPFFFTGGFFFGSPFYPYYPYYPGDYYGGYGYGPAYSQQQYSQPVATDNGSGGSDNTAQLSADVQNLSDQVADLRAEESSRALAERNSSGTTLSATEPATATVFIFGNGQRISAKSYAIAGTTLWIFDEHAAHKYQMSDLDAAATEKANAANGVDFHVPAKH